MTSDWTVTVYVEYGSRAGWLNPTPLQAKSHCCEQITPQREQQGQEESSGPALVELFNATAPTAAFPT